VNIILVKFITDKISEIEQLIIQSDKRLLELRNDISTMITLKNTFVLSREHYKQILRLIRTHK